MQGMMAADWTAVFIRHRYLGNTLVQWAGLLGALLAAMVLGKLISYWLELQAKRLRERDRFAIVVLICNALVGPIKMLLLGGSLYVAGAVILSLDPHVYAFWLNVCTTVAALAVGWFVYRLVDVVEHFLGRWTGRTQTQLDDQLVPLVRKSLRVFVVIIVVLFIAQNVFKWDIGALIAGLGIGGLAFALAAQDMLGNFFGSVMIFSDRPFQMGELVRIADYYGVVEEVGFRSTKIRTLDGHLVTIPNSNLTKNPVENVGRRPSIKRVVTISVTYDTPAEKVQQGMEIIRELLDARSANYPPDLPPRVYFNEFANASLNIVIYCWFVPADWWAYCEFWNDFNLDLLRRFNEAGIEFAFPTQTLYLKQDSAFSAEVRMGQTPDGSA